MDHRTVVQHKIHHVLRTAELQSIQMLMIITSIPIHATLSAVSTYAALRVALRGVASVASCCN